MTDAARLRLYWLFGLSLASAAFSALFHPQFLGFDSYHYMTLSFHPVAYGSHPLAFGFVLRVLARVSEALWNGAFVHLFQLWQVACAALFLWCVVDALRSAPRRWPRLDFRSAPLLVLGSVTIYFVVPAVIYLMNGYLTEMTSFALIAAAAMLLSRGIERDRARYWAGFAVVGLVAYNVRYQLLLLPLAGLAVLVRPLVAGALAARTGLSLAWKTAPALILIPCCNVAMEQTFPTEAYGKELPNAFLARSIQCRLRCDVRLFETGCDDPDARASIEHATCGELVHSQVDLGPHRTTGQGALGTLSHVGLGGVLRWIVAAPIDYLDEIHIYLDDEGYAFDENIRFLSGVKDAMRYYAARFPDGDGEPSYWFGLTRRHVAHLFLEWRAYHWIARAVLLAAIGVVFVARNSSARFLAAVSIGTYLVFSYLQPQVPVRFLVQIAVPGLAALWIVAWEVAVGSGKPGAAMATESTPA